MKRKRTIKRPDGTVEIQEFDDDGPAMTKAQMAAKGRNGDDRLAHVNGWEEMLLKKLGGSGTTNPRTGMKEFYTSNVYTPNAADPLFDLYNKYGSFDEYRGSQDFRPEEATGLEYRYSTTGKGAAPAGGWKSNFVADYGITNAGTNNYNTNYLNQWGPTGGGSLAPDDGSNRNIGLANPDLWGNPGLLMVTDANYGGKPSIIDGNGGEAVRNKPNYGSGMPSPMPSYNPGGSYFGATDPNAPKPTGVPVNTVNGMPSAVGDWMKYVQSNPGQPNKNIPIDVSDEMTAMYLSNNPYVSGNDYGNGRWGDVAGVMGNLFGTGDKQARGGAAPGSTPYVKPTGNPGKVTGSAANQGAAATGNPGDFFNIPLDIAPYSTSTSTSGGVNSSTSNSQNRSGLPENYQQSLLASLMPQLNSAVENMPGNIDKYTGEAMDAYNQQLRNALGTDIPKAIAELANRGIINSTEGQNLLRDVISKAQTSASDKGYQTAMQAALLKANMPQILAQIGQLGQASTGTSTGNSFGTTGSNSYSYNTDPTVMYRTMADLIRAMM